MRGLPGDGLHERVEEGFDRRLHVPVATPGPLAKGLPEVAGLPGEGSDGVVIGGHLREEDLDLGRRTLQQDGVNALLLAPAPDARNLGLQTGGDLLAEGVGGRGGHHDRGLQYELGQARTERDQGEGDHAGSLRDRAAGMCGAGVFCRWRRPHCRVTRPADPHPRRRSRTADRTEPRRPRSGRRRGRRKQGCF